MVLRIYRTCWLIHNQSTESILRPDFVVVFASGAKVERRLQPSRAETSPARSSDQPSLTSQLLTLWRRL
jgi:hypothetical protein